MIENQYFSEHIKCTRQEKMNCIKIVNQLLFLVEGARRYGLYELEQSLTENDKEYPELLKIGLMLVVDGTDPKIISDIFENYILSGEQTNGTFLENMLIYSAVIDIQKGENPFCIKEKLCSFFGIEFRNEFYLNCTQGTDDTTRLLRKEEVENLLESVRDVTVSEETESDTIKKEVIHARINDRMEQFADSLDDRSIQRILREIDINVLEQALHYTSEKVQNRFYRNLSSRMQTLYQEDQARIHSLPADIAECAAEKLFQTIEKLGKSGEIIIHPGFL